MREVLETKHARVLLLGLGHVVLDRRAERVLEQLGQDVLEMRADRPDRHVGRAAFDAVARCDAIRRLAEQRDILSAVVDEVVRAEREIENADATGAEGG